MAAPPLTSDVLSSFQGYGKMGLGTARGSSSVAGNWCVTEKVHGANFSLHMDRIGRIRCAKRTAFLATHENFFGHFSVLARIRSSALQAANDCFQEFGEASVVILFGELFGGRYSHPDVPAVAGVRPVQTGIWYSPRVEFILFDVAIRQGEVCTFVSYNRVVELAVKHELLHARPLLIAPRGQCAAFAAKFPTGVPAILGLPAIDKNFAEGIVAKPWDRATAAEDRPILKVKIKEFSEGDGCPPAAGDPAMEEYLLSLVNTNRLAAAVSKVGDPLDRRLWDEIVQHVIADIVEEVGEEDECFVRMRDQLCCETYDLLADAGNGAD